MFVKVYYFQVKFNKDNYSAFLFTEFALDLDGEKSYFANTQSYSKKSFKISQTDFSTFYTLK